MSKSKASKTDKRAAPGQRVRKSSNKPFKSGLQWGTVKGLVPHPNLPGIEAYTFEEDDSVVRADICFPVEN